MNYFKIYFSSLFVLMIGGLSLSGCSNVPQQNSKNDMNVTFVLDDQYEIKIQNFKLSPSEAAQAVYSFNKERFNCNSVFLGAHYVIVENEYVFSPPKKSGVSLSGVYIDGNSGEIREVHDGAIIPWSSNPDWKRRMSLKIEGDQSKIYPLEQNKGVRSQKRN